MWSESIDTRKRNEVIGMASDAHADQTIASPISWITEPTRQQMGAAPRVPELRSRRNRDSATNDTSIKIGPETEDVVYVLRKRRGGNESIA
jgi:hypothetical protein